MQGEGKLGSLSDLKNEDNPKSLMEIESPAARISIGDRRQKYFMHTKSQDSGSEHLEPRQVENSEAAYFNLATSGAMPHQQVTNNNMSHNDQQYLARRVDEAQQQHDSGSMVQPYVSHADSKMQRTVGLTPEKGLSPNEFMFPQPVPMQNDNNNDNKIKVRYEGSVDSMTVLEQMDIAEQKERQMALAAAESQVS